MSKKARVTVGIAFGLIAGSSYLLVFGDNEPIGWLVAGALAGAALGALISLTVERRYDFTFLLYWGVFFALIGMTPWWHSDKSNRREPLRAAYSYPRPTKNLAPVVIPHVAMSIGLAVVAIRLHQRIATRPSSSKHEANASMSPRGEIAGESQDHG